MLDPTTLDQAERGEDSPGAEELGSIVSDGVLVDEELLVEEISIDGMCGVY